MGEWAQIDNARRVLASERGAILRDWGGRLPIVLAYPNTYSVGMSSLAIHGLYRALNALPGVVSRYWWQGKLEKDDETLLVLKTSADRVADVIAALKDLHPYDVPELLSLPVEDGNPAYLDWVNGETR